MEFRWSLEPVEKTRDRQACDLLPHYRHGCECSDATNPQAHAGGARQSGYRAVAERRGRHRLLTPAAEDHLRMWPVSRRVNKTGSGDDNPAFIEEVAVIEFAYRRAARSQSLSCSGATCIVRGQH